MRAEWKAPKQQQILVFRPREYKKNVFYCIRSATSLFIVQFNGNWKCEVGFCEVKPKWWR